MEIMQIFYPKRTISIKNGKKIIIKNNASAWKNSEHKNTKTISNITSADFSTILTAQKITEEYYKKYQEKQIPFAYKFIREENVSLLDQIQEDFLELKSYAETKYSLQEESEKNKFKRNISSFINILYGFTKRISDPDRISKIKEIIGTINRISQSLSSTSLTNQQ